MVPACQGYLSIQTVSSEKRVTPVCFQSRSHSGIAASAPEHRERRKRIAAVAREQPHRVEPEVRDLRDEVVAPGLGQHRLDRLLSDLPLAGLAVVRQEAPDVRAAI